MIDRNFTQRNPFKALMQHFPFLLILSKLFNLSVTPLLNCSEFIAIMNTFKGHKFNKSNDFDQ